MEQPTYLYVKLTRTVARYLKEINREYLVVSGYNTGWIYYIQVHLQSNCLKGLAVCSAISINFKYATIISALEFKKILFEWSLNQ